MLWIPYTYLCCVLCRPTGTQQMNTHYHHKRPKTSLETQAQRLVTISAYYSLKKWNNTLIYCSLKRATVTSPALFLKSWEILNFEVFKGLSVAAQKRQSPKKKDAGRSAFFSVWLPAPADALSSLRTIEKRRRCLEKTPCGHWPWGVYMSHRITRILTYSGQ